jgi:hypothetical protein
MKVTSYAKKIIENIPEIRCSLYAGKKVVNFFLLNVGKDKANKKRNAF